MMQLQNPFPLEVRTLYLDCWECWLCGRNGWNRGGLEIHHIWGRISASALNSSCLCGYCHKGMGHSREEQHRLLRKTIAYLLKNRYRLQPVDNSFLDMIANDLRGFDL